MKAIISCIVLIPVAFWGYTAFRSRLERVKKIKYDKYTQKADSLARQGDYFGAYTNAISAVAISPSFNIYEKAIMFAYLSGNIDKADKILQDLKHEAKRGSLQEEGVDWKWIEEVEKSIKEFEREKCQSH